MLVKQPTYIVPSTATAGGPAVSVARAIVNSLWGSYSTQGTAIPALLLHGSRSVPHNRMDHALIYGDYYFFEALTRIARPDIAARAFPAPQPLTV